MTEIQHRFVQWLKMFLVQGKFRCHPLLRLTKKFSYSSRRTRFTLCPKCRTGNRLALAHLRTWERLTFVSLAISLKVINILLTPPVMGDWLSLGAVELKRQNLLVVLFSQNPLPGEWWKTDARWYWLACRSTPAVSNAISCWNGHRPYGEIDWHSLILMKLETPCVSPFTYAAVC